MGPGEQGGCEPGASEAPSFHVPGHPPTRMAERLAHADIPRVQRLFERCADHFLLHDGEPPGPDAAEIEFDDVPPGCAVADKHVHGVTHPADPTRLIAVLESVRGYPDAATWFIGLLLVDPAHRSAGLGTAVLAGFEAMAGASGCTRVRLAVIVENVAARRFWERHGFVREATSEHRPFGHLRHDVDVLVHELGPSHGT